MAGAAENQETGILGGSVLLDVEFRRYTGGPLVDDDGYLTGGTLPTVRVYDPDGILISDSSVIGAVQPVRVSVGSYTFSHPINLDDVVSDYWQIVWNLTVEGNAVEDSEYFRVVEGIRAAFDAAETRIGYSFDNPDTTSDHHAPNWGLLFTPDELRYIVMGGIKLVSPDTNATYDDNMLQSYIDRALAWLERDLNISLLPRKIYHRDSINITTGEATTRTDMDDDYPAELVIREDGYAYRPNNMRHFMFVKLENRPLRFTTKAVFEDPNFNTVLDIWPWRREKKGFPATVQFVPVIGANTGFPLVASSGGINRGSYAEFPQMILIDYEVGYESAADVPSDFRQALMWLSGVMLMNDFGDVKSPGLASASVNLNSISESYATTQSATNALYGARIAQYLNYFKAWYQKNENKFSNSFLGVL